MKISNKLLGAAVISAAALGCATSASAMTVDGITFLTGEQNFFSVATVYEDRVLSVGSTLSGIGQVLTISAGSGVPIVWTTGTNGRELTYAFSGFKLEAVIPPVVGTTATLLFSGGSAQFYSDTAQNFTSSAGQATNLTNATDGDLWLSTTAGASYGTCGVFAGSGICTSGDGVGITLVSTVDTATLSAITSGHGSGSFDVIGGLAAGNFDTNAIVGGYDLSGVFDFSTQNAGTTDYDLFGSADFKGTAIPEPATMGLFGLGLIGLGALARRRKSA